MRILGLVILSCLTFAGMGQAQTQIHKDDARFLLERITGVKWAGTHPLVQKATQMIANGDRVGVTALAVEQPQFLNVTVKNFGLQMSTREETIRLPLNDFTAAIVGVTRDETDARELLYGNFYYRGPATVNGKEIRSNMYSDFLRSNNHYEDLDDGRIDFGSILTRVNGQKLVESFRNDDALEVIVDNPDPAGVLTLRTWIEAHAIAGTNRRPVEYTFREFLCIPIEQWADATASDVRIGRDVDRFPGGEHVKFQTSCKACHTGMDGFRGAWARWDFSNETMIMSLVNRGRSSNTTRVMNKMNQNSSVYPGGYVTSDDSWVNNAILGTNATTFGWRGLDGRNPASGGKGVNSFGRLVANSQRFSTCMAKRAFEAVCRKSLGSEDIGVFKAMGTQFEGMNYNLKRLFQLAALHPRCK